MATMAAASTNSVALAGAVVFEPANEGRDHRGGDQNDHQELVQLVQQHPPETASGLLLKLVGAVLFPAPQDLFLCQAVLEVGPQDGGGFGCAQGVPVSAFLRP